MTRNIFWKIIYSTFYGELLYIYFQSNCRKQKKEYTDNKFKKLSIGQKLFYFLIYSKKVQKTIVLLNKYNI